MQQRLYPLCVDCRSWDGAGCSSRANLQNSLVTGQPTRIHSAEYLRDNHSKCGRDGQWFVIKLVAA